MNQENRTHVIQAIKELKKVDEDGMEEKDYDRLIKARSILVAMIDKHEYEEEDW